MGTKNMLTMQDVHDLQKSYVDSLLEQLNWSKEKIWELVRLLWPKIEELGEKDGLTRYRITMTPLANTLGAIMGGDHNVTFHTGAGVLQTLPLVAMCSAATSHFKPGYMLKSIEPDISFSEKVPIGTSVIMSTKLIRGGKGKRLAVFELQGRVEGSDRDLFLEPRRLTMFRIPRVP